MHVLLSFAGNRPQFQVDWKISHHLGSLKFWICKNLVYFWSTSQLHRCPSMYTTNRGFFFFFLIKLCSGGECDILKPRFFSHSLRASFTSYRSSVIVFKNSHGTVCLLSLECSHLHCVPSEGLPVQHTPGSV